MSTALEPAVAGTTTTQRVGLVLGALYSLSNVPAVLLPTPDDNAPPTAYLVVCAVLGLLGVGACLWAWRGNERALRIGAAAIIVVTLIGLPALFVDTAMGVKALTGLSVPIAVVIVVLMFSRRRGSGVAR